MSDNKDCCSCILMMRGRHSAGRGKSSLALSGRPKQQPDAFLVCGELESPA